MVAKLTVILRQESIVLSLDKLNTASHCSSLQNISCREGVKI